MTRPDPHAGETLRCRACGLTRAWFRGWAFTGPRCSGVAVGTDSMMHDWELIAAPTPASHDEAFAALQARKRAAEAADPSVSWRRVSILTGGGWAGSASTGGHAFVRPSLTGGGYVYGLEDGVERPVAGRAPSLVAAKAAAAALLTPTQGGTTMAPKTTTAPAEATEAKPDPKQSTRSRNPRDRAASTVAANDAAKETTAPQAQQGDVPPVEDVTGQDAPAAPAPGAVAKALHDDLLKQVREIAKGTKSDDKKAYVRVTLGGKTLAYVHKPGAKARGVRVEVPRTGGSGYVDLRASTPADAEKVLATVRERAEALTTKPVEEAKTS